MSAIVPIARGSVSFRLATLADFAAIDALQKQHSKALGYFRARQLEEYIEMDGVLIAEEGPSTGSGRPAAPVGYVISRDRYLKRDELGVIFQLCVAPGEQRKLIGAALVREVFARSAYGCRLYCCWCAQDLEANRFWESMGFLPIAFRAGSGKKRRVHIFWQRRIREGDTTTPYWFPSKTSGGAIGEDRLVFPIPPGTHWSDAKPIVLPGSENPKLEASKHAASSKSKAQPKTAPRPFVLLGPPPPVIPQPPTTAPEPKEKPKKPRRPKRKHAAKHIAAARELRDRWLEHVNAEGGASSLLSGAAGGAGGKYDVARSLGNAGNAGANPTPLLPSPKAA